MRPTTLKTLTWATVAAAVASALWLAAVDADPGTVLRLSCVPAGLLPFVRAGEPGAVAALRRRDGEPGGPPPPQRQR